MKVLTFIAQHMFCENHCKLHRISAGMIVAAFGLCIYKLTIHMPYGIDSMGEFVGFGIHGVGWGPIVEPLAKKVNESKVN